MAVGSGQKINPGMYFSAFRDQHQFYYLMVNGEIIDLNDDSWKQQLQRHLDSQRQEAIDRMKRRDIPAMVVAHSRQ